MPVSILEEEVSLDCNIKFQDKSIDVENEAIQSMTSDEVYEQLLYLLEDGGTLEDCLTSLEKANKKDIPIYQLIKEKINVS